MTKRESGYYWVRIIERDRWRVAQWNDTDWFHVGIENDMPDPEVIGPKIEPPGAPGASMTETLMKQEEKAFWEAPDWDEKCR